MIITNVNEKASVCLVLNCTGSQGCPLFLVCNNSISTDHNTRWTFSLQMPCPVAGRHVSKTTQLFEPLAADTELTDDRRRLLMPSLRWKLMLSHTATGGWVATAVTCEGSDTCHILSVFVSPSSSFLFLFAVSFPPSQQASWFYIHMSDAPQMSSQHILDLVLLV